MAKERPKDINRVDWTYLTIFGFALQFCFDSFGLRPQQSRRYLLANPKAFDRIGRVARRKHGGLIHQIGKIGTREARRLIRLEHKRLAGCLLCRSVVAGLLSDPSDIGRL